MSQKHNIEINTPGETIIRHGEAMPAEGYRESVHVYGNISTARVHLENPSKEIEEPYTPDGGADTTLSYSYVEIERTRRIIAFREDAGRPWEAVYAGELKISDQLKKFNINSPESRFTPNDLARFLKLRRSFFSDQAVAMNLIHELNNFEAKINNEVRQSTDNRANISQLRNQVVSSNIPESFEIDIPIFQGRKPVTISVEIEIHPETLKCTLVSYDANDFIETTTDEIIDQEKAAIKALFPTLRIFEL